jgi:alkylglycerol monooxygenase
MIYKLNYLALIIPVFLIFIALEYLYARHKKHGDYYTFNNTVSNLCVGIAERLMDLFFSGSFIFVYQFIYQRYALFHFSTRWYVWLTLLLATDFIWYWYHRLSHNINIFWSAHIVHHQSEDFNLTVAARITIFQAAIRCGFWAILPFIGFHPLMVTSILIIHGAYSFFTHTRVVGKLGILEYVLVTPSHHRVHHASDEKYLDKNYGDIFIIWDKLFGTFQQEEEEPQYGITHPLKNNSFLWQHFHYLLEMFFAFKLAKGFKAKWDIVFGSPGHINPAIRKSIVNKLNLNKSNRSPGSNFKIYVKAQIIISVIILSVLVLFIQYIGLQERVALSLFIILTLINCGALLEQNRWIYYLEISRLYIPFIYLCYQYSYTRLFVVISLIIVIVSYLFPVSKWYRQQLFETA